MKIFFLLLPVWFLPSLAVHAQDRHNIQIQVEIRSVGAERDNFYGSRQFHSTDKQMLVVTDGLEARIFLGKRTPYVTFYRKYLEEEGYLTGDVEFINVGTSLVVRPRTTGNLIEVTLTPEISYDSRDGRGSIQVQRLSTTVLVPDGQTTEIGAASTESQFDSRFYTSESGQAVRIFLTPRILER